MTESPTAIMEEFDRLWAIEWKLPRGPNVDRIVKTVADQFEVSQADVAAIVRDRSVSLQG